MKLKKSNIIVLIILIIGISLVLYPTIADFWNSRHQSVAVNGYIEKTEDMSDMQIEDSINIAKKYNIGLLNKSIERYSMNDSAIREYNSILDITGTGIMGYVDIPKIKVRLPIYHGTDESILQVAVGHIPGTSFPIGGYGTHSVLSGHSALPSAKLFTDIDKLEIGDTFNISVLNEVLTYEVDNKSVVLPTELADLEIDRNKDYITLLTCTPYGVNSHRLLVRGIRTYKNNDDLHISTDAVYVNPFIVSVFIIGILLLLYIIYKLIIKLFLSLIIKKNN